MYIKVLQRNIEPKEKSRQTKLAKKKRKEKKAKRKEINNINSGDRKDKISTSGQSLLLSRLLLLLDSQVYISVIIKQDQCYLIDRRSGGPLPWVPEVFSRVCRGASFRRPKGEDKRGEAARKSLRACLHGVGNPGLVGLVSFVFTLWGTHKKETYPTRPGSPTPCKQGLRLDRNRKPRMKSLWHPGQWAL